MRRTTKHSFVKCMISVFGEIVNQLTLWYGRILFYNPLHYLKVPQGVFNVKVSC